VLSINKFHLFGGDSERSERHGGGRAPYEERALASDKRRQKIKKFLGFVVMAGVLKNRAQNIEEEFFVFFVVKKGLGFYKPVGGFSRKWMV
jgi:hypothetical protein